MKCTYVILDKSPRFLLITVTIIHINNIRTLLYRCVEVSLIIILYKWYRYSVVRIQESLTRFHDVFFSLFNVYNNREIGKKQIRTYSISRVVPMCLPNSRIRSVIVSVRDDYTV